MSVKIEGLEQTIQALYAKEKTVESKVDIAIRAGAVKVLNKTQKSMKQTAKTGLTYKRGKKTHTASAAGEAPAVDTGRLVSSIQAVKSIYGVGWLVGTNVDYGKHLEFGTRNIKARPWLLPALEKSRKAVYTSIEKAIRSSL